MKRLMMTAAALVLLTTVSHVAQDCARFEGEDEAICKASGVKAVLKMQRQNAKLAKQGKLCGDYWGQEDCKWINRNRGQLRD